MLEDRIHLHGAEECAHGLGDEGHRPQGHRGRGDAASDPGGHLGRQVGSPLVPRSRPASGARPLLRLDLRQGFDLMSRAF